MKELDIPRIEDFIKTLSAKDLIYLNRMICERLKVLSQVQSSEKMAKFHLTQRVSFTGSDGLVKTGVINAMHKKTVSVITDDNENWKIAPGLLRSVE